MALHGLRARAMTRRRVTLDQADRLRAVAETPGSWFIPGRLRNPLNGSHRHWATRFQWGKDWRTKTAFLILRERPRYRADAPKRIAFRARVWSLFDDDGLRAALKPVRDGLRDAGIVHDDSPRSGHEFVYEQVVDRRRRGVEVRVEVR